MKKFYALLLMVFAVAMGVSAQTYYNGKLDVEMVGEKIADGMDARVSLSESADGTYVFKLPDFRITINETELPCGDIVVEGVTRKDGKLSGSVNDLSLAMGQIHAKVDLVGTETAEGVMDLAITVGWYTDYPDDLSATMPINVTFKGQKYDSVVTEYPGKLDVEMLSEMIVSGQDAKVYLQTIDEGVYMFKLPDFRITINETELPCGDIVIEGVTRTANAAGFDIAGSVNDLSLAGGEIHAKVDLVGTETAEGAMDLTITVGWYTDYPDDLSATMPINVTFKGQRGAGVNVVEASGAAVRGAEGAIVVEGFAGRVNVYTVDGRLAASAQVDGEAALTVAAGLYVVRAGEKAVKLVVK